MMRGVFLETLPNVNIRDPSHDKNLLSMSVTGSINQNVFKLIERIHPRKTYMEIDEIYNHYNDHITSDSLIL